jgi:hypothetical protein
VELNDFELRGLYFEFGSLHRLSCSGDPDLNDSVAEVLPIAVATTALLEIEIVYLSNNGVLWAGEGVEVINALPALMAFLGLGHW